MDFNSSFMRIKSALLFPAILIPVIIITLLSCEKKVGAVEKAPAPGSVNCDTISYAQDIAPIILASCSISGCHVLPTPTGPGVLLDTYDLLKDKAVGGRIKARVLDASPPNSMPPQGLNAEQKKLIECWLNNGYKP